MRKLLLTFLSLGFIIAVQAQTTLQVGVAYTATTYATASNVNVVPLPIKLQSFTAANQGNNVNLNWSTASENGNYGFNVERSNDGNNYQKLSFISGKGSAAAYSYADNIKQAGTYNYRLEQLDWDGGSSYSKTLVVNAGQVVESLATAPNPFSDELLLSLQCSDPGTASVQFTNVIGKIVISTVENLGRGDNTIRINTTTLPAGIYQIRVQQNGNLYAARVIKN